MAALLAGACNRGAAEESLAIAEESLEEARPDLEARDPTELTALHESLKSAREDLREGRYTDALRTAQELPARVRAARDRAARRQLALEAQWADLSTRVPSRLVQLRSRRTQLLSSTSTARAVRQLDEAAAAYERALEAHRRGDLVAAVARALEGEARLDKAAAALARAPRPPAPAPPHQEASSLPE